jgi:hypothetical protein
VHSRHDRDVQCSGSCNVCFSLQTCAVCNSHDGRRSLPGFFLSCRCRRVRMKLIRFVVLTDGALRKRGDNRRRDHGRWMVQVCSHDEYVCPCKQRWYLRQQGTRISGWHIPFAMECVQNQHECSGIWLYPYERQDDFDSKAGLFEFFLKMNRTNFN